MIDDVKKDDKKTVYDYLGIIAAIITGLVILTALLVFDHKLGIDSNKFNVSDVNNTVYPVDECMVVGDKEIVRGVFAGYDNKSYCCSVGTTGISCLIIPEQTGAIKTSS